METSYCTMLRLVWLACAAAASLAPAGDHCAGAVGGGDVACRVRTLDAAGTSLQSAPAAGAARLAVACSPLLLFESALRPHYFRRLPGLSELSIVDCKLPELPADTFEGLRELKRLSIWTRNSDWSPSRSLELAPGAFRGLRELHTLDLAHNNLRAIRDDVLCPLDNLVVLNLTRNRLRSAERLGFGAAGCEGGASVQTLDLSHNELTALEPDSDVSRLRRLRSLALQHNNISRVAPDALAGLLALRTLNLSHNALDSLPDGLFASARELREVYLNGNMLFELAKGIFHRLEQLLVLDLSSNTLTSNHIDDGTFVGLIRLIVLNLSHNALTRVDGKTFKDLFFLQILDLRNNSIGYIEENAFLPLYNLHTLNLAENRLHTVDEHLFNGLYVLSKLTLNNNLLADVHPRAFRNCSDLKELDLSSNQITEVPRAISELAFLKTLDLGENQISQFKNGSFKNLGQLTGLRLIENQIGNLTVGMFWDLPSLQVLNLAKNKIQSIERGTFHRNGQLEAIRLDGNFVSDINGVFSTLTSLLWLNLSENHLVWFDYAFIPPNLKWLDIHGNFIEHLGNYYKIQNEIRVKTLDVSHNRLVEISPMAIPNSVELLFINNNFINNVQVNSFVEKKNLTRVDMYANEIVKMDLNSLRLSPVPTDRSLPEFYVGGNPFHCDCSMEWLPLINNMTSMRQHPRVMDLENVMCKMTHSRSVTHLPLTSIQSSDFLCQYDTHCFALCHCCDFDACDCEMTCPQNCSCYHDPLWNTNVVDCSGQRVIDIPHRIPMDATDVYLDGNNFKELLNHGFIGRKNMRALYANGSGIETIQNRTFAGLSALRVLSLASNKLTELRGYEFEQLPNLQELFLQNNLISYISNVTFAPLNSIRVLRLDGNRLVDFSLWTFTDNAQLSALSIGNNLWSCKCKYLRSMTSYLAENWQKAVDIGEVRCWDGEARRDVDLNGTACSEHRGGGGGPDDALAAEYLPALATTLSGFVLALLALVLLFAYRDALRVALYTHCGVRPCAAAPADDRDGDYLYDAYVCYSPKDEEFVVRSLAAELERGAGASAAYRLCLHHRDVPTAPAGAGAALSLDAADASRRVVVVLTRNFMQTEWARFEFRQALHAALRGRAAELLVVEEGAAGGEARRDPELRPYYRASARVRWRERRFWQRLRYALPEPRGAVKSQQYRRNINTYTLAGGPREKASPPVALSSPAAAAASAAYGPDGRPPSEHIYTSIDSDYSTLERGGRRREQRRWPPAPSPAAAPPAHAHAYLV